jgi:hypothetical protein
MKVYLVPQEYITSIYSDIEKYIDKLTPTTHGRFDKIDILNDLLTGRETLWTVVDEKNDNKIIGVIFTEISHYPRKKMLSIQYASGDKLDEWMEESLVTLENWAVDNECTAMEITGRRGWVKKLKKHNWEEEFVVIKKEGLNKVNLKIVESEKNNGKEKRRKQSASTGRVKDLSKQTA